MQSDYIYKCKREVKRICPKATINDGVFYCKRHLLQQKISFGHASLHLCIFASFYSPDVEEIYSNEASSKVLNMYHGWAKQINTTFRPRDKNRFSSSQPGPGSFLLLASTFFASLKGMFTVLVESDINSKYLKPNSGIKINTIKSCLA